MGSQRAGRRASMTRDRQADHQSEHASSPELPTVTTEIPVVRDVPPGKRRAVQTESRTRGALTLLPSLRAAAGVAVLAVAAGGVVTTPDFQQAAAETRLTAPSALSGANRTGSVAALSGRSEVVSRDSERQTLDAATDGTLRAKAERQAAQRDARLGQLAKAAEKEAGEIKKNAWVLPLLSYRITARFGQSSGLWSSTHTGLDFAAPSGTPIRAVSGGTVTSTGYEGAYGNQTVITAQDGTEIWYCHQTSYDVSVGDVVHAGEIIGYVGSTGNSTGPHLHLEVRPGGGDPVDPYAALVANGVAP